MIKQLTWFELSKLADGARVAFVEDWDIFPECIVRAGETATVTENGLNEMWSEMWVRPDSAAVREILQEWDGRIQLAPPLGYDGDDHDDDPAWQELSPLALAERN